MLIYSPSHFISFLLLISSTNYFADSFPSGAGGCPGGMKAVNGTHLTNEPLVERPLGDGVTVTISGGDIGLEDIGFSTSLIEDTDYTITITSTSPFTGALIRADSSGGVETDFMLIPDGPLSQYAMACIPPVQGVTHTDRSDKTTFSAIFRADEPGYVTFDITVVFWNNAEQGASHRFSRYFKMIEEDFTNSGDGDDDDGLCFSGSNIVEVQSKGLVPMSDLRIGDYVKVEDNKFSRVYSFGHLDPEIEANFLQIYAHALKKPIELSHDHVLYVGIGSNKKTFMTKRSKDVKVGDYIVVEDEGESNQVQVTKVQTVKRRGVYNPITESGNIVVSGVLASCYVAIKDYSPFLFQWGIHAILSPLRLACHYSFDSICMQETYTDGLTNYYYRLIEIGLEIAKLAFPVQLGIAVTISPMILTVYLIEQIFKTPLVGILMTMIAFLLFITFYAIKKPKKNKIV